MRVHKFRLFALLVSICLAVAGCSKGTTPGPAPLVSISNISGDYSGTIIDTASLSGTAAGTFAQHGGSAGAGIVDTTGSGAKTLSMTLTVNSSNAVAGTIVLYNAGGSLCTFSTTGTYSNNGTSSATLSGSYAAVTNCAGETGTYLLTQKCTNTVTVRSADRRRMTYPPHC